MSEIIIEERYLSAVFGTNTFVPKRFLGQWWFLGRGSTRMVRVPTTVRLLADKFQFRLSAPFNIIPFYFEESFGDIEKIEIRSGCKTSLIKTQLISLSPKSNSATKAFFFVRNSEQWINNFEKLGLKIEYIER